MLSKYQPPEGIVEPWDDSNDRNAPLQPGALLLTKGSCFSVTTVTDFVLLLGIRFWSAGLSEQFHNLQTLPLPPREGKRN